MVRVNVTHISKLQELRAQPLGISTVKAGVELVPAIRQAAQLLWQTYPNT